MQNRFDRPPANLPSAAIAPTNPFGNLHESPQLNQRSNQNSLNGSPQLTNKQQHGISTTSSSSASSKNSTPLPFKKQLSSEPEDFGSEDALRGIESGLRNMERAMQEQMNIRSLEAAQVKTDQRNFNPIDFKRNIGGSATSLDGSGNTVTTGPTQNMSVIESMRLALSKNMRSMERGSSMDQMKLDHMHLTNSMRAFEANSGNNVNTAQRPLENHMKSLDRNLPLELQYSRHHHRSQSQQEAVEQLRQNLSNPITATTGLSREDLRLRRRSSHDENQISQTQNNNAGNNLLVGSVFFIE